MPVADLQTLQINLICVLIDRLQAAVADHAASCAITVAMAVHVLHYCVARVASHAKHSNFTLRLCSLVRMSAEQEVLIKRPLALLHSLSE